VSNKYHAQPVVIDGIRFDSKREAARYNELRLLEMAGEIEHLEPHPKFHLQDGFTHAGTHYRPITYRADFRYRDCRTGQVVVEDVKGGPTADAAFRLRMRLLLYKYPYLDFRVVT
jgi:hypothetical protein